MGVERIATDTYDFEIVRSMGYTYVDKTATIYPMVEGNIGRQFFLSRPRRFGMSLMTSPTAASGTSIFTSYTGSSSTGEAFGTPSLNARIAAILNEISFESTG